MPAQTDLDLDVEERARVRAAQDQFAAEVPYLNTPTMGLPPRASWEALQAALRAWRAGTAQGTDYDAPLSASRAAFADLVGAPVNQVALGSQVSVFAGLIAAGLPDGAAVLVAEGEFTSMTFPFAAQAHRGVTVREVPLDRLVTSVRASTSLVAVSAVQSSSGLLVDQDALVEACAGTGTKVFMDLSQAAGWLPVDAGRFAYTATGAYKWLLSPRGTAYFTIAPELVDRLVPHTAGWYAGNRPWDSIYGLPLRLAPDARRFDVSPAWHGWVGAAPAMELLLGVGRDTLYRHALGLANAFRDGVGLPPGDSAIVSVRTDQAAPRRLAEARVAAAVRAGRTRLGFHISTSEQDVERAVDALRGHVVG